MDATAAIGAPALLVWPWRVAAGIEAGEAAVVMDARAVNVAASVAPAWDALGDVLVPVVLRIARASVGAQQIASLSIGDVVLTDLQADALSTRQEAGAVTLAIGAIEVPAVLHDDSVTVADVARSTTMTTRRAEMPGSDDKNDQPVMRTELLSSLPVDVDVVVARAAVPLAEVSAWRVGEVVAFPSRIGELVEVRAGGRVVARGELCDVEGQLGVRVTELL
jgi:type III secretion system YscQ/HrcQ family protein